MGKFWELLEESVITQAMVTLMLVGAIIFLVVTEKAIPDALFGLASMALGFYFGAKGQLTGKQAAKAAVQQMERKEKVNHGLFRD